MSPNDVPSKNALVPREALVAIAIAAARADGSVLPCEADRIEDSVSALPMFRSQSVEATRAMFERVARRVATGDITSVMREAAEALPGPLKGTAFAIGEDVLLADGRMQASELQFVEQLRRVLRVRRSFADAVVGVLRTKNLAWSDRHRLA